MDPTLTAILGALYAAHQTIDHLRQRVAELEESRNAYDRELGDRARVNLELRDQVARLEQQLASPPEGIPPGWRLVRDG